MSHSKHHLSPEAQKAVISASVIVGTLIVAFIVYALWRWVRGATYSEIIHFRRHSGTIALTSQQSREAARMGLPIYQENRYSVHSSRFGSTLSFGNLMRRPSGVPSDVARRFHRQNPWVQSEWETGGPSKPVRAAHTTTQVTAPPPRQLVSPEMAQMYTNHYRMTQNYSAEPTKADAAVSINETEPLEAEPLEADPPTDPNLQTRWSWTNSQAPSTIWKYPSSIQSSLSSLPRFMSVRSWVRSQAERHAAIQAERIDPEQALPSRFSSTTAPSLASRASNPKSPQKPKRKLSKRSLATTDLSLVIQQQSEPSEPVPPIPARLAQRRERRLQTLDESGSLSSASFL